MRVVVGEREDEWGTVEYIPGRGLVYTGDVETMRDLVDECRTDFAYGRDWRRLTDEEIPEHILMRFRHHYCVYTYLLNDDGTPAEAEAYQPIYAKWRQ
jgi:hypothetical protein